MHHKFTGSTVAEGLLQDWPKATEKFVKVMPTDYKRVLMERKNQDAQVESSV